MTNINFHTFYEQFETLQNQDIPKLLMNLVEKIFILLSSKFQIGESPILEFFEDVMCFGWKSNPLLDVEIYDDLTIYIIYDQFIYDNEYNFSENEDLLDEVCKIIKNNLISEKL